MKGHIRPRGKDPKNWSLIVELGRDPATGKRRQKWMAFRGNKREAQAALAKLITQINEGTYVEPAKITVAEHLERWLEDHAKHRVADKTYRSYKLYATRDIIPRIGHLRLRRLTPPAIEELLANLRKDGATPRTVEYAHAALRAALSQAVRWGLIQTNPASPVSAPTPPKRLPKTLDTRSAPALLRLLEGDRLYLPTLLAIYTGMRRGEVLGLAWSHVDLESATLYVSRALASAREGQPVFAQSPSNKNHLRPVAVSANAVRALRAERHRQSQLRLDLGGEYQGHDLVICRDDGRPWDPDNFTHVFRERIKELGYPELRFHDLRHSHATMLIVGGTHAKIASARLGHSQIGVTMNLYGHVQPGMDRAAAESFDKMLEDDSPAEGLQIVSKGDKKAPR